MKRKAFSALILTLLLTSIFVSAFNIQPAKAGGTIYIRADGSIDPPTAPISTVDNITYTFADNINDSIVVERSNIIIDGAGYTLQGTGSGYGVCSSSRSNVTIKNMQIKTFYRGIYLDNHSNNIIAGNNITNNGNGIYLSYSSNSIISGNNITANNEIGIELWYSANNNISGNTFTNNGMFVYNSYGNMVDGNVVNGKPLVYLEGMSDYIVGNAGQVILVNCNGIRVENLNLFNASVGLELWGTNNSEIANNNISGNNVRGIALRWSSCNNTVFGNNIASNSYGIRLELSSNNNSMIENNITACSMGIYLDYASDYNNMSGNNITNGVRGICLFDSSYNVMCGNNITNNSRDSIFLGASYNNVTRNNITANTLHGIYLDWGYNNSIFDNSITNNWIGIYAYKQSYNPEIRYNSISKNAITNNGYGIHLYGFSNNSISGNNITDSYYGVELISSSNNTLSGNNIANNVYGVYLYSSSNNTVSGNNATANIVGGIFLSDSSNNTIVGNNATANGSGIALDDYSNTSSIFHNNFVDNTIQASAGSSCSGNVWDNGYPSGGNYWSNYTGVDLYCGSYQNETGSDGIGDTPHIIDAVNQDHYPLMKPYSGSHDVGITALAASKTVVGQGYNIGISGKIINYGEQTETFSVTIKANSTTIQTQTITLTTRNSTIIGFNWNTSGFAKANYTLSAYATPVPGEAYTADNTLIDGSVFVGIVGDVNGNGKVDLDDVLAVAIAFGSFVGTPRYEPNLDIDGDGKIDLTDYLAVVINYGKTDP